MGESSGGGGVYKFMPIKSVGKILCTTEETVTRIIKSGDLKAIDIGQGKHCIYRVRQDWLDEFIEASIVDAKPGDVAAAGAGAGKRGRA